MYKVAVIGAAGFTGAEAVRLLLAHPVFSLSAISSNNDADKPLASVYPYFAGRTELSFCSHEAVLDNAGRHYDLVFLAVPHTAAMKIAPPLLKQGVSIVDLSADFRLHEPAVYESWYGLSHTAPELLAKAVYGLPEVFRSALQEQAALRAAGQEAVLVANPGCYPTASVLAALPVIEAGFADSESTIVINAISGVSGAGKTPSETTHFCTANENLNAYGATTHRHTPEIAQTLSGLAKRKVAVQFTPHLAPLSRGMVSTVAIPLSKDASQTATAEGMQQLYEKRYAEEPFVQVLPAQTMPKSSSVAYGNHAQVGVAYDSSTNMVVASCAIDNLGKGAAAQAVQCANILFGLDETAGLAL
ncbi:MAG: N-acetyl-gamma-glutamyl-phosphate reductase [Coriobacteriia bacterium]|nr:N-acetyl-gamma-glutamyl-phosphate reductase [Coriobacteriia bacterium]